ncbi:hypothetical protein [Succinatimonas hippei]|uniref:hypothetical protein n=1 Tax=Succinatimonas hippei TaxID=626938 RepID=UPI0023F74CD9|nr:hypothetical protein [Succinatimonas hippei]
MPMGRYTFSVDSMSFMAHVVKPDQHSADSSYPQKIVCVIMYIIGFRKVKINSVSVNFLYP